MRITRRAFIKGTSTTLGTGFTLSSGFLGSGISGISRSSGNENPRIIPYPQFQSWGKQVVQFEAEAGPAGIFLAEGASAKEILAAGWIENESSQLSGGKLRLRRTSETKPLPGIYIMNWSQKSDLHRRATSFLDESDLKVLSDNQKTGQGYVIRVLPGQREVWLIGTSSQGALNAAATLLQMLHSTSTGVGIPEAHIRDYPDFPYRAASDWLVEAEINRWAYDWGDGRKAYIRRVKRKLDFCLRYKINMVFFEGFAWNSEKIPGYAQMMREFNAYARDRGIKLIFGGYGANYESDKILPERNIGKIWYNREKYPHGPTYPCFGEAGEGKPEHPYLGTCRANDELNKLKAEEMIKFVRSVEPGALYIHHEDTGWFDSTQKRWLARDERCRRKWPNDDFSAKDGGAGAMAYGYNALLEAICSVKNSDTGYDASKDCTVILVSPVYAARETKEDWERVLTHWKNIVSLLPKNENIQICFREIFPQESTDRKWVDTYKNRLDSAGLNSNVFLFFFSGATQYSSSSFNYPFVGTSALSGIFNGATAIYYFNGGAHQEPLQLLNAEFAWNTRAPGHHLPTRYQESKESWEALMSLASLPEDIFSTDGFLTQACRQLYGPEADRPMRQYFTDSVSQPRSGEELLVPVLPARLFPISTLRGFLELDRRYWSRHASNPAAQRTLQKLKITDAEWHKRLSRVWSLQAEITSKGTDRVNEALTSSKIDGGAREDLEYLTKSLQVGKMFLELLSSYHEMLSFDAKTQEFMVSLGRSEERLRRLNDYLASNFSFDTLCPTGGDQATWLESILDIRNSLQALRQNSSKEV
jgi:Glycosyl hydrolase family 20, domain 2